MITELKGRKKKWKTRERKDLERKLIRIQEKYRYLERGENIVNKNQEEKTK